jgi:putative ABC transport system permease protein
MLSPLRPARSLRRYWKLTAISVFSLSIAMALGVLALSISYTALLLPPPAPVADRLVTIYARSPGEAIGQISYPDYQYLRDHNHLFTGIAAAPNSIGINENIDDQGRTIKVIVRPVSENYFAVLGIRPYLGRLLSPGDDKNDVSTAVMTWSCWKRLGADRHIVGKQLFGRTIVGVAPPEFKGAFFGVNGDIFTNFNEGGQRAWLTERETRRLVLTARLKPGVTRAQAQAEMTALSGQLASAYPKEDKGRSAVVTRATLLPPDAIPDAEWMTGLLVAMTLLVLLIACANVANLLLAAAVGRRQEAAIKLAIGAPRGRLIREFLGESLLLCAVSGAIGYAMAAAVAARFADFTMALPMWGVFSFGIDLHLDAPVVGLSLALVAIASLATGLAPAFYASSPALSQILGGEIAVGGTRKSVRRNALVIVQVAVCTLALIGMGLCQRSLHNLRHADLGFSARNLMAVNVYVSAEGYDEPRGKEFYNTLRRTVSALPGVQSVTLTTDLPLNGSGTIPMQTLENPKPVPVGHAIVDGAYFATIGLPLVAGRAFDGTDRENGPPVAVINRKMAEMFWPGQSALGKTILAGKPARQLSVVGVAANSKYDDIDEALQPFLYYNLKQNYNIMVNVVARTRGDPKLWLAPFSKALRGLGLKIMIDPITFDDWVNLNLFGERMTAIGVAIFGVLGLLLAMIGLLGAVSYSVGERKKELGIRVALGAQPGQLLAMVLRQTAMVAGGGIVIGLLLGIGATTALRSQLYQVGTLEWTVLLPVGAAMMALSLAMAYISARPWLKVDPMETVRHA